MKHKTYIICVVFFLLSTDMLWFLVVVLFLNLSLLLWEFDFLSSYLNCIVTEINSWYIILILVRTAHTSIEYWTCHLYLHLLSPSPSSILLVLTDFLDSFLFCCYAGLLFHSLILFISILISKKVNTLLALWVWICA